jgi:thermitase
MSPQLPTIQLGMGDKLRAAVLPAAVTAAVLALPAVGAAGEPPSAPAGGFVPGEVLVRYQPGTTPAERAEVRGQLDAKVERRLPIARLELLDIEDGSSVGEAVSALEDRPEVAYAEPNFVYGSTAIPDDPLFPFLWGLDNTGQSDGTPDADVDAPEAWEETTGSASVAVAVVDTGVATGHADLDQNLWTNPGEEANGVDDDGNGLVDDLGGWDWVGDDGSPDDPHGHGTHVAGTIGAEGNNGKGVTGVSWDVSLMPLRVLADDGYGTSADVAAAFAYAGAKDAAVVNASLSGSGLSLSVRNAIAGAPGTLFVVAAGNGGEDSIGDDNDSTPQYPCNYRHANLICVAATTRSDVLAGFSNFGSDSVDLAAPGVGIRSTYPKAGGYRDLSGTSMATPHVAGGAALLAAARPGATVAELRALLLNGVDPKPSLAGRVVTGGRLNLAGSLAASTEPAGAPDPDPELGSPASTATPAPVTATPTAKQRRCKRLRRKLRRARSLRLRSPRAKRRFVRVRGRYLRICVRNR